LVSVSLDFPCMAHVFSLISCLNTTRGLCHTFLGFAQNLMLFLSRIHHNNSSCQIHDFKQKDVKNQHIYRNAWNFVHWFLTYASTIIYCSIALL
jgi:hypothetical protein